MKKITQFSVDYPITVLMLVLVVLLLGYISFQRLGIDLLPDLKNPRIFITLKAGERPPEEIEKQFVERIESLAIRLRKVVQVSSTCRVGSAQIEVEYAWNTDMDEAFLDLQKNLTSFSQNTELDELNVSQHDPNSRPVMVLGLASDQVTDMNELRKIAENYLRNELIRLEGIAAVEPIGAETKEVVIQTDPYILQAYNLTADEVVNRIQNYNRNASGGSIVEMGRKYIIKGVGEFQSLDDIRNIIVSFKQPLIRGGLVSTAETGERVPVFLKDLATVEFRNQEPTNIVHVNGKRCMALAIYKETKFNTVQAVENLMQALAVIKTALPGYELLVIQNQAKFITTAIDEVKQSALVGILLAVLILYVFLRRIGTTLVISLAIPISIIATFNLMFFNGLTLNIMTLGGLALGAGMLVDNAIVVMENIARHLETGTSLKESAVLGTAQVSGAITASTLTTIVVFLPIVYLHGAAGELFKDQAWTVTFSLLSSLVVAVLVIPMLANRLLNTKSAPAVNPSVRFSWYPAFLERVLARRWWVIAASLVLIAIAIVLIPVVGSEFIPKTSPSELVLSLKLPEGTELRRTEKTVAGIEQLFQAQLGPDLALIYSQIGPANDINSTEQSFFEDENTAELQLFLPTRTRLTTEEILSQINHILEDISDLEFRILQEQTALQTSLGTESVPIVVEIKGEQLEQLQALSEQVKQKLSGMPELMNVETTFDEGRPEINLALDRVRAGILGISVETVRSQLQDLLLGKDAGQWENKGDRQDITLRLPRIGTQQLDGILINTGTGQARLDEIARIHQGSAPKEILRRNQVRIGQITAQLRTDQPFDRVVRQIEARVQQVEFPPDYRYQLTGEELKRKEAFQNLRFALILSIILVYMVMASQFESLVHPFTILLTIPLAGVGAVFIFFILGKSFTIMAYIGIILLAGIAVNNSIILVDAINQLKKTGLDRKAAILEAGQRRIRPILMTSLTTILALLPLTFGFGESAALRAPMALAVIGGLTTSTILTLIVIPCVYWVFDVAISGKNA